MVGSMDCVGTKPQKKTNRNKQKKNRAAAGNIQPLALFIIFLWLINCLLFLCIRCQIIKTEKVIAGKSSIQIITPGIVFFAASEIEAIFPAGENLCFPV